MKASSTDSVALLREETTRLRARECGGGLNNQARTGPKCLRRRASLGCEAGVMGPRATGPDDQDGEHNLAGKCSFANLEKGDGGHNSECKTRVERATCDDAVGRNVSKNPRDEEVKVAPGTGVVMGLSSSSREQLRGATKSAR